MYGFYIISFSFFINVYNVGMWNIIDIKNLYEKYDVRASKRFGQNFLIDQDILKKIITIFDIKNKDVIEIGPGLGSLTSYLLQEAKSVTSYEVDLDMIRVLKGEINDKKFHLIEGDFLKKELSYKGKRTLIANIPYNITSDILFKLFENTSKINQAVLMIQKEVAERLTSKVGSKNYGKLSISAQHFSNINLEFKVPSSSFVPIPKVTSAVISMTFNDVDFEESKPFLNFVKKCFAMRRKTLLNNLKNFLGKEKSIQLMERALIKLQVRPQELTYNDFVNLFNCL